ncbi:MAG: hypothetical protein ACOZNI_07920 [Myxococcota bacterium]
MLTLLACSGVPVLDAPEFTLEARNGVEACTVCALAGLEFAVLIHNPTDEDGVVETGLCLVTSGELENETTGQGVGWDDLCPEGVERWEIPAGGTVEHMFTVDEVEPGVQTLTVHLTDERHRTLSVGFEGVE